MKKIFFIILIFQTNLTFSQSKKEQIELLKGNVDSLKTVLENERNSNLNKVQDLNSTIENFENQISSLKSEVKEATYNLNQKNIGSVFDRYYLKSTILLFLKINNLLYHKLYFHTSFQQNLFFREILILNKF